MENLYRFRFYLLPLLLIAGIALWPGLKRAIQVDNSLQAWFIEDDPALASYFQFQEDFGNDELVFLVYEGAAQGLSLKDIAALKRLEKRLEDYEDVDDVLSPFDVHLKPKSVFQNQGPLWLTALEDMDALNHQIEAEPFFKEQFFDPNKHSLKLLIQLALPPDFEERRADILKEIYRITDEELAAERSYFGGLAVIYEAMNSLSQKDFSRFLGIGYLLMFIVIGLLYRLWQYVFYAISTIALATYFTLAIYGLMGHRLNLLSTLIPAVIILLSVMDVMHILNERNNEDPSLDLKSNALKSLKNIWKPCLFTSLSTMAGFLSLSVSPVLILANFGIYAAIGIAFGLLFSFWLGLLILPKVKPKTSGQREAAALVKLQKWVLKKQKWVLTGFIMLIALAGFSIPHLMVDTNSIAYLPEDHQVRSDSRRIEALYGPYMPLDFSIECQGDYTLQSPEIIEALIEIDRKAEQIKNVGRMQGYHEIYRNALEERYKENWKQGLGKASVMKTIGDGAERMAPQWVRNFTKADYKGGRFVLSGELVSAGRLNEIIAEVDSISYSVLGEQATVQVSGYQSLYGKIVNYVTKSQVRSLSLATVLVFLLLWLFLRDLRLSIIALIPNFFPVLILLASMAWLGIALDTATASIASIVLSFSIDDTMHFIWRYRELKAKGMELDQARTATIAHVGRAILYTSLVLFVGYSLMLFGELKTVIYFGSLTALSIVAALLSQFFLFPILLKNYDRPLKAK